MFSRKFSATKVQHGGRIFDMDPKIDVLLKPAKSRDSRIDSIVESVRLRARYTKSHAISSTEARERAIFSFHGGFVFCGVT